MGTKITVKGVQKSFNGRMVVNVNDLTIGEHPIEGLIGPNGAGKTTLMSLITGKLPMDQGDVVLHTDAGVFNLGSHSLDDTARMGLVRTNQLIQDFDSLSIRDSFLLSLAKPKHEKFFGLFAGRELEASVQEEIDGYLDYFKFEDPKGHAMSAGEKKLLDIIRCLMIKPKLLLMDEPTAGLPDDQTRLVMELMKKKAATEGMRILIVEHDLDLIWEVCEYVHFLAGGELVSQGTPEEIRDDPQVIANYIGGEHV